MRGPPRPPPCWPSCLLLPLLLLLFGGSFQVRPARSSPPAHPGFKVLLSASHYWPLEHVDGIQELQETAGDLVEGKVSRGIYLREQRGVTLLHYGPDSASCLSNPAQCGPQGVTFSFFWKTHGEQARPPPTAHGGQVVSDGFKVCSSGGQGSVELHTRDGARTWEATFSPPGPHWTHVLFTWRPQDGLKVYVNGSLSTWDARGRAAPAYGEPSAGLVLGPEPGPARRPENGAFDEFVVWERALTPEEVALYFTAAVGKDAWPSTLPGLLATPPASTPVPADARDPLTAAGLAEEEEEEERGGGRPQSPGPGLPPLQNLSLSLPAGPLTPEAARNLTEAFLQAVGAVLLQPSWTAEAEDAAAVLGLIETVDVVLGHVASSLRAGAPLVAVEGSSSVAEFSVARLLPSALNASGYRFPARGLSYIAVPQEAFRRHAWSTAVGLLYHTMHRFLSNIRPHRTRIAGAAICRSCPLSAASSLLSLEVVPRPALSQNLSGSPLTTVRLQHRLTSRQLREATNETNRVFLYCAFLDFSSGEGVWSDEGCVLVEGSLDFSVCRCTHLTNFAILMQVVPLELPRGHQVALASISYIGCSLSALCLAVTLATFAMLSSVSTIRNQRYHIHANLSFAVLVAQVLLLVSFHCQPGTVPCRVLAVLLHFFFLSAFAWMLAEGLHLYGMVIRVFGAEGSRHRYYYGIGWGCPLLVCAVSVSCALDSYGTTDNCWLSLHSGAIWAFVGPALLVILVNIGILVAVTRVISQISADNYKVHGDPSAFKLTAKAVAVLLPILGTSWVFGVLAVNSQAVAFQYAFALLNSLQGFFIFLFHCLLNSEVRAAFKHKTKVWSLSSSSSRPASPKPFSSDATQGTRPGSASSKLSPWHRSSQSVVPAADLSPV